jgi:ABC-2 type transport system permease protein
MKMRRVRAVARKEFLHVLRDPRSLGMGIAIPMMLLILFGYARNYREMVRQIDTHRAVAALVVPRTFAQDLDGGRRAEIQFIVDGSDSTTGTLALAYANQVSFGFTEDVVLKQMRRMRGQRIELPLDVRPRVWYNADLESRNFIVPGLIAVIMMVIAALLTSLTISREWERGTMEQLISTPVKGPELIVGKLVPYFAIGMFDVLVAVLMGEFLFHVPLRGSIPLLFGVAALFLVGVLSMGMLISIATKNQLLSSQLAMVLTFLPSFLLSGFVFAIPNMPLAIQAITHIVPARYFVALLKGIYLKGVGLEVLGGEVALLAAFTVVMFALAIRKLKKKLAT